MADKENARGRLRYDCTFIDCIYLILKYYLRSPNVVFQKTQFYLESKDRKVLILCTILFQLRQKLNV